ncbi:unnamed protein product [Allacma fusca]|uniref:C2H2-type domain-containing protein n=1 Tax=Allacma fusca TaxID=39272 RepID=A0A8J2LVG3_9HEXA|nr:unnamed protein product [Allacma fusca]
MEESLTCDEISRRCMLCWFEIKDTGSTRLSDQKLSQIFDVLETYMEWESVKKKFQFKTDLFPFCDFCFPVVTRISDLNEEIEVLLGKIHQLTTNVTGKILESHYRDASEDVRIKEEFPEEETVGKFQYDLEKVLSYRNSTIERFTPNLTLPRLVWKPKNIEIKKTRKSARLGSQKRDFEEDNSQDDGTNHNDDDHYEMMSDLDYRPPSTTPSEEIEIKNGKCDKGDLKNTTRTRNRSRKAMEATGGKNKQGKCRKPYRLVEISPNVFVHADKFRIRKLSDTLFECLECTTNKFTSIASASAHAYFHSCRAEKRFQCRFCEKAFGSKNHLTTHTRIHTNETPFKCDLCEQSFRLKRWLIQHQIESHRESLSTEQNNSHKKIQNTKKQTLPSLQNPESNITEEGDATNLNTDGHCETLPGPTHGPQSTMPSEDIKRARKCVELAGGKKQRGENWKPYRLIETSPNLFVHANKFRIKKLSNNLYECLECSRKPFSSIASASAHAYFHSCRAEKRYQCRFCEKAFGTKNHLTSHTRIHTKETPFKCDLCEQSFRLNWWLKQHKIKSHGVSLNSEGKNSQIQMENTKHQTQIDSQKREINTADVSIVKSIVGLKEDCSTKKPNLEPAPPDVGKEHQYPVTSLGNDGFHHHDSEDNVINHNNDEHCEKMPDPDYGPPRPSEEIEAENVQSGKNNLKTTTRARNRPRKARVAAGGKKQQGKKRKPYRLVEISPNLFVHANQFRIKKLSDTLFECLECTTNKFTSITSASAHAYFHSCRAAKRYQCKFCEKSFCTKSHLTAHTRIHTNETPFKCDLCEARFKWNVSLTRHKIKSHGKHEGKSAEEHILQSADGIKECYMKESNVEAASEVVGKEYKDLITFLGNNDSQHHNSEGDGTNHKDDHFETILNPDCGPPSPSQEVEVESVKCDKDNLKTTIRASKRPHKARVTTEGERQGERRKSYRLVETSPNLFVHADKFRIKKLSDTLFECLECTTNPFSSIAAASAHAYFHSCRAAKRYQCKFCEKAFGTKNHLTAHTRIHTNETPFKCDLCDQSFRLNWSLTRHKMKSHGLSFNAKDDARKKREGKHQQLKSRYALVEVSPDLFVYKDKYQAQKISDHWYECLQCSKTTSSFGFMCKHLYFHYCRDTNKFRCEECGKAFSTKNGLEQHRQIHSNEKSFMCEVCGHAFNTKNGLQSHMKRCHTKTPKSIPRKDVICHYCGKTFICEAMLKRHLTVHTGVVVKPLNCEICGKLLSKYKMKEHMIRHGPPRFPCSECSKSFHMSHHLRIHLEVKHGGKKPFSCDECGKSFGYKESIVYHKNRFHSAKSAELNNKKRKLPPRGTGIYPCDQCGKLFYRMDSIKYHMKRYHSELTAELDRQLKEKLSRRKNKTEH